MKKKALVRSHPEVFWEKVQNLHRNSYARVPFLIKLQADACIFIKKRLWQCFSVNFPKFLKTRFLQNTSGYIYIILIYLVIKYSTSWLSIVNITHKKQNRLNTFAIYNILYLSWNLDKLIKGQGCHHIVTCQLTCKINWLVSIWLQL